MSLYELSRSKHIFNDEASYHRSVASVCFLNTNWTMFTSAFSQLLLATIGQYLLWYSAEAICGATSKGAAEWLAIGWRRRLTHRAQGLYCSVSFLRRLSRQGDPLDNPDERITNEIKCFCENLAQLALKTIAAPLMILYYSWWVAYHVGWFGPLVIYAFFAVGATWIRWIISPIAALVARQERLEAEFRISHVRFRANSEGIVLSNGVLFERLMLEKRLQDVLSNKKKLVSRHFLLAINTKALDYLGGVLNYVVLAIPVFAGTYDSEGSGELANMISNASFSVLQLIYSFSQVLDTAKLVSDLAGHTSRLGEFFEDLAASSIAKGSFLDNDDKTIPGLDLESYLINAPAEFDCPAGRKIQFSIHFVPNLLIQSLQRLSPPVSPASLLIVPLFEMTGVSEDEKTLDKHISRNLSRRRFGELLFCIERKLDELGYWTEVFDEGLFKSDQEDQNSREPNLALNRGSRDDMGNASFSARTQKEMSGRLSCADAVKVLLGYNSIKDGPNLLLHHPTFGEKFSLSFVVSAAPITVLRSVLKFHVQGVCAPVVGTSEGSKRDVLAFPTPSIPAEIKPCELPAVEVEHATSFFPGSSSPVMRNLSFQMQWGESLLVMGPAGSGKSSFLRALCGLWPLHSGEIRRPPLLNDGCMLVLPQKTILAQAGLGGQVSYPEKFCSNGDRSILQVPRVWGALQGVGMTHLLNRCNSDWEVQLDWTKMLSPGEQQSVALARVLYHRPRLVILDEVTSALSEDAEGAFYQRLLATGMSIISVSHSSKLIHYHTKVLVLAGDGSGKWTIS